MRFVSVFTIGILASLVLATPTYPEEYLVRESGARYLGTRLDKDTFKTCKGTKLAVGKSKLEPTEERCPPDGGPKGPVPKKESEK